MFEQTSYCFCSCSKATFSANDTCPLLTGSLLNIYKKDSRLRCKFFSFSSSFLSSSREHDEARQSTNHFLITNRHIKAWCTADIQKAIANVSSEGPSSGRNRMCLHVSISDEGPSLQTLDFAFYIGFLLYYFVTMSIEFQY